MKTNSGNQPAKKSSVKKTAGAKKSPAKTAKKSSKKSKDDDADDEFEEFGIEDEFRTTGFKSNDYDEEDEDY